MRAGSPPAVVESAGDVSRRCPRARKAAAARAASPAASAAGDSASSSRAANSGCPARTSGRSLATGVSMLARKRISSSSSMTETLRFVDDERGGLPGRVPLADEDAPAARSSSALDSPTSGAKIELERQQPDEVVGAQRRIIEIEAANIAASVGLEGRLEQRRLSGSGLPDQQRSGISPRTVRTAGCSAPRAAGPTETGTSDSP